jgi:hypothetical protein
MGAFPALCSVLACSAFLLAAPLRAAEPGAEQAALSAASATNATLCLNDLRGFDRTLRDGGYWLTGTGFDFGDYADGTFPAGQTSRGYLRMRPAFEIEHLMAAANILAGHGQQDACEAVLATTREIYQRYLADLRSGDIERMDPKKWRDYQIAKTHALTSQGIARTGDGLIGADVRSPKDLPLGTVTDLIVNPTSGKIEYLVLTPGSLFEAGADLTPIPWQDFKATLTAHLLVLPSSAVAIAAAPKVQIDHFTSPAGFDQQSRQVDLYWKKQERN